MIRFLVSLSAGCLLVVGGAAQRSPFATVHDTLPHLAEAAEAIAVGDLDGDGDLDALVGCAGDDRVWLNDGLGVFVDVSATHWPGDRHTATDVALADLDGDGDLDAVVAQLRDPVRVYANDGAARFTDLTAQWIVGSHQFPSSLALRDLDGDGDIDLYVGHGARLQDRLYLNDGSGRLVDVTATHLPVDAEVTFAVEFADVDLDGDLDVVLGALYGQTRLYRNAGSARFTDATSGNLPIDSGPTRAVGLGDIDGDGDPDIVLAESSAAQNRCYVNDGSGRFVDRTASLLPQRIDSTFDLALKDLDRDGDLDLLLANWTEGGAVLVNDGAGSFSDLPNAVPVKPDVTAGCLALGDLDADGDPDALVGTTDEFTQEWLCDGAGRFVDATPELVGELYGGEYFDLAVADFDGDGDGDAFVACGHPFSRSPNVLLIQDRFGNFQDRGPTQLPRVGAASQRVASGDLDGDGDVDLVVGNLDEPNQLLLNDGAGRFTDATATHVPPIADLSDAVALCDVDGDGDLDLWAGDGGAGIGLWLNDGSARFGFAAGRLPAHTGRAQDFACGDVDGDGDRDLYLIWRSQVQQALWLNDGSGYFTDVSQTALPVPASGLLEVEIADLDADGDLDLCLATDLPGDALLLNDGQGHFTAAALPPEAARSSAVAVGDVDGDGDPDLALGASSGGVLVLWNDGSAGFTAWSHGGVGSLQSWTEAVALADLDGDLDPDLIQLDYYVTVLPNRGRHLGWRGLPRVGKPLRLDVEGAPHDLFALNAAVAPAWIPTPVGVLRFDPASFIAATGLTLGIEGRATVTFAVPADPALLGFSLYWQAAVGGARIGVTNLETTRFTGG